MFAMCRPHICYLVCLFALWLMLIDLKGPVEANGTSVLKTLVVLVCFAIALNHANFMEMNFVFIILFLVLTVVGYFVEGNKQLDRGMDFPIYIYLMIHLYKMIELETVKIALVLLRYLHDIVRAFKSWRLALYIAVTTAQAFMAVFVVCQAISLLYLYLTSILFNKSQFVYNGQSLNTTNLYEPIDEFTNLLVHEDNLFMVNNSSCILENKILYYSNERPEKKHNNWAGVLRRFDGEDVEMHCEMTYTLPINLLALPDIHWRHNDRILYTTSRHRLNTSVSCDGAGIKVVSILRIALIQESDYGTYNCSLQQTVTTGADPIAMPYLRLLILNNLGECNNRDDTFQEKSTQYYEDDVRSYVHVVIHHAAFWKLERRVTQREYITVPVGRSLRLLADFLYVTFDEKEDIEVEYQINNRSHDETCSDDFSGCFLSTFLYIVAMGDDPSRVFETRWIELEFFPLFQIIYSACVCPSTYGEHRVHLYRNYYNASTKTSSIVEVPHHKTIFVFPDNETYTSYLRQGKLNYSDIRNNLMNNVNIWGMGYLLESVHLEEAFVWYIVQKLEIVCFPILLVSLTLAVKRLVQFYSKYMLRLLKNRCLYGAWIRRYHEPIPFAGINDTVENNGAHRNDVFLSCCAKDEEFVHNTLLPTLESWGARVYLYSRDCLPGKLKLEEISQEISSSAKIIVVVSKDYLADPLCNWFQSSVILSRVCTGKTPGENVLLLKYRPSTIPDTLIFNPTIVIHDWTPFSFNVEDGVRHLRRWLM